MFSIVGNFHVWDDWYIGDDKLTKFHVCSYFPNKHLGFNLRSSNKQNPKILRKAKTRKFWTNRLNFVPIRPQKYLFNFTFSSCFLIIWNVFIFSQKNLKRACLVCYSIHTVDFKIHSSVECSSSLFLSRLFLFLQLLGSHRPSSSPSMSPWRAPRAAGGSAFKSSTKQNPVACLYERV